MTTVSENPLEMKMRAALMQASPGLGNKNFGALLSAAVSVAREERDAAVARHDEFRHGGRVYEI